MNTTEIFLIAMAIIFTVPYLLWRLGRTDYWAPLVVDAHWFNQDRLDLLRHHVLLVMRPVFFLSTGLRTHWGVGGWAMFSVAALLLVAAVVGKLVGVRLAVRILGWPPGEASLIGWLLQTKALIMIIFANILLDKLIISADTFTALLPMAVASTMLTIPRVAPMLARLGLGAPAAQPGR